MANPATRARSIGDYDKTFGKSLDEIENTPVFIHDWSIGVRSLTRDGETGDRPFTTVEVSDEADGPTRTYHTWSESIAAKLSAIDKAEALSDGPIPGTFKQETTGAGRTVWTVE